MSKDSFKIDFSENIEINHPKCVHGPTLLFYTSTSKFFACSACRNRHECNIFIPYEMKNRKKFKKIIEQHDMNYKHFRKHIQTIQKNRKMFKNQDNM